MITFDLDGNGFQAYITQYALALDDLRYGTQSHIIEDKAFYDNKVIKELLILADNKKANAIHVAPAQSGPIDADVRAFLKLPEGSEGGLFVRNGKEWERLSLSSASALKPTSPPDATTKSPSVK